MDVLNKELVREQEESQIKCRGEINLKLVQAKV